MKRDFTTSGYGVRDNKVLLVFHKKLNSWLPIGGHIESNELPEEAIKREFKEESGLEIELVSVHQTKSPANVRILHMPHHIELQDIPDPHEGFHQHIDSVFFCTLKDGKEQLETEHHKEIRWFSKEELEKEVMFDNVRLFALEALNTVK